MSQQPDLPKKLGVSSDNRETSIDSTAYFEGDADGYGDYDDFAVNNTKGRASCGGNGNAQKKSEKGVYTSKHIRAKEAMRQNQKSSPKKKWHSILILRVSTLLIVRAGQFLGTSSVQLEKYISRTIWTRKDLDGYF